MTQTTIIKINHLPSDIEKGSNYLCLQLYYSIKMCGQLTLTSHQSTKLFIQ